MTSPSKKQLKSPATVITTHINADFDAIASMLAAQKLYPEAQVVFPGSAEKNIRNFFINSMAYLFNMADIDEIDPAGVKRLVLVDTRRSQRIGKLSELLESGQVEIHIFDHHLPGEGDIRPDYEVYQPTGATVTILTHILKAKQIPISPEEATIMCLGIYEDTGSFTFSSTTEQDFLAAAYLLSRGANLNIIADLTAREFSPEQVGLLNDLIKSTTRYKINGIEVAVSVISTEDYVPDFAFLVHKMQKMESLNAFFAVARMGDKVHIVARSRIPEVNVVDILTPLEGGGHPFAAAATIRDKTLVQVESLLLEALYQNIRPARQAADLMSSPAITAQPDISCKAASRLMTQYNVNALLITRKQDGMEDIEGYISRQVIEKALYHKLDHVPVREYMSTELAVVDPTADLTEIQEKIIERKQRILPVVDKGVLKGVITRTDLLTILVDQSHENGGGAGDPMKRHLTAKTRNIRKLMRERLSSRIMEILVSIGQVAHDLGFNAYIIGGLVRDLFLYRPNEDVDIVVEGDGIALARKYAEIAGVRVHTYDKFGTAVIIYPDGFKIDVASARMEYYKFPAALPTVEMSSLKLDLFRRDFTINTLAVQLSPDCFGILLDFFSAQRDLKEKTIRILHNLSFVEDPTRVFRAIRFEQRFHFTIGKLTAGLIENAVKMDFFKRLSGRRVFSELRQILEEDSPAPAISRLADFNLLPVIHPAIHSDKKLIALISAVEKVLAWHDLLFLEESYNRWTVYFLALIKGCTQEVSDDVCRRLELAPRHLKFFSQDRLEMEKGLMRLEHKLPATNSGIYNRLKEYKIEQILFMMAATRKEEVERALSHYVTQLRHTQVLIRGKDLMEMGVPPGPMFREILDGVLAAKLDGRIQDRRDEFDFVKARLAKS
ncbi:MAG: CBS domain-containing protein [Thermodesulfobacteriota bacterium]